LCENYHFTTIGVFLYIELFKGMELHYLPKRCGYCDRYFLLEASIFSDYCTLPVKGMGEKSAVIWAKEKVCGQSQEQPYTAGIHQGLQIVLW
jgi:hypothetical protein